MLREEEEISFFGFTMTNISKTTYEGKVFFFARGQKKTKFIKKNKQTRKIRKKKECESILRRLCECGRTLRWYINTKI